MTIATKTFAAAAATFLTLSGSAFADGHVMELNVGTARLDATLDTDGDGDVSDSEIIEANQMLFDLNMSGTVDAVERQLAEQMLENNSNSISTAEVMAMAAQSGMSIDFNAGAARLDTTLDTDGDGQVSTDEVIAGNMALFDTDGSGAISAAERGVAETLLVNGNTMVSVDASAAPTTDMSTPTIDFDPETARLDNSFDTNGDGEITDRELIEGNAALFDTNNDGVVDAEEQGIALQLIQSN